MSYLLHFTSEPIINHPIQNQAWTKIAADPFCWNGHFYLLINDYYSKFIVTEAMKNLRSELL